MATVDAEALAFRKALLDAGLLIDTGVQGVYGHGEGFEAIRRGLERLLERAAAAEGALSLSFSPVMAFEGLRRSGYLDSFPHLATGVFGLEGVDGGQLRATGLAMAPAACYPVYPALAARGPLSAAGMTVHTGASWVFRREPSADPARLQSFRMQEFVRAGQPAEVAAWREQWVQRAAQLLERLGLEAQQEIASDPFFGRAGRLLAASQREQQLKLELRVSIVGSVPVAVASLNLHREHFALAYGLRGVEGAEVHTACVGFGHERLVLALLAAHGVRIDRWPSAVRKELGL